MDKNKRKDPRGERPEHFREDMEVEFYRLARVLEAEALELIPGEGEEAGDMRIPYMMNDALEYILVLENVKITGEYNREIAIREAEILHTEGENGGNDRYALVLRMEDDSKCSIFFDGIHEKIRTYACHEIGHFWVGGDEQWRRLVYIIGTIHDKYDYFEDRFCNEREQQVMWLIEFGPLRDYSPIGDSIAERYPSSKQGTDAMIRLAEEAGDLEYLHLLKKYRRLPLKRWEAELHRMLGEPERWELWNRMNILVRESQQEYGSRSYGAEEDERIRNLREETDRMLWKDGFRGRYPRYYREQDGDICLVTAAEEHPFTEMERADYRFEIQLMISEGPKELLAPEGMPGEGGSIDRLRWELGFFRNSCLRSRIQR